MDEVKQRIRNHPLAGAIERDQFVALAALALGAAVWGGAEWTAGVLAGGLLMAANFRMLRNLVERFIFQQIDGASGGAGGLLARMMLKLLFVGAAIVAIVVSGAVDLRAFLLGTSALILAIAAQAARSMLVPPRLPAAKKAG